MSIDLAPAQRFGPAADGHDGEFARCYCRLLPGEPPRRPYVLARFRPPAYSLALFARHGIDLPVHIGNSVAKRQAEFLAGRLCAQRALAAFGLAAHRVAIGGQRQPLWPDGYVGSITHNGQYAAAVVCPAQDLLGIGIDIETLIGEETREAMMALVVSDEEASYLRGLTGELGLDALLTLVFSAKESFFKAAFAQVGQFFDFDAVQVHQVDIARGVVRFRCVHSLSSGLPAGHESLARFEMLDGAVLTVVLLKTDCQV